MFAKGNPGGPGRPKGVKVKILRCAKFMDSKGWKRMEEVVLTGKDRDAVEAGKLIASYGYGKPSETIDVTSDGEQVTIAGYLTKALKA